MSNKTAILSFDAGTSGIKAVLVDFLGRIIATAHAEYSLIMKRPGWAEQIPSEYWEAACKASRQALTQAGCGPEAVAGIVFATQWKGMIPLDKDGNVLYNSIIWLDTRADKEAEKLSEATGRKIVARDYWPRLMWYKHNHPDLFKKTACILEANGYLKYRACGIPAIDESNHFTRSPFADTQEFFTSMTVGAGIEPDLFPPVVASTDIVGYVSSEAATQLDVEAGIPVFGGLCDIPAIAIGSGAASPGSWHMYLGSSGWLGLSCKIDEGKPLVPIVISDDTFVSVAGLQSVCMSYDWAIKTFYPEEYKNHDSTLYALVENEIRDITPGSEGLLAVPSIHGESWASFPPDMRAGIIGMNANHSRAHLVHAFLEGICFLLRIRKETIEQGRNTRMTVVNVVGGGTADSHWMQMIADVMDAEVRIPENPRYSGALGAAYCALVGVKKFSNLNETSSHVPIERTFLPSRSTVDQYNAIFCRFKQFLQNFKGDRQ